MNRISERGDHLFRFRYELLIFSISIPTHWKIEYWSVLLSTSISWNDVNDILKWSNTYYVCLFDPSFSLVTTESFLVRLQNSVIEFAVMGASCSQLLGLSNFQHISHGLSYFLWNCMIKYFQSVIDTITVDTISSHKYHSFTYHTIPVNGTSTFSALTKPCCSLAICIAMRSMSWYPI